MEAAVEPGVTAGVEEGAVSQHLFDDAVRKDMTGSPSMVPQSKTGASV